MHELLNYDGRNMRAYFFGRVGYSSIGNIVDSAAGTNYFKMLRRYAWMWPFTAMKIFKTITVHILPLSIKI
jgi:hypothetical protein